MSPRTRRSALRSVALRSVALLGVPVLAGCASEAPGGSKAYYVYGHVVEEAPSDATVVSVSDDRIDDVEPIQRVSAEAEPEKGGALYVNETTYERVKVALRRTPLYRNEPGSYGNRTGLYVNASGKIVRISIVETRLG